MTGDAAAPRTRRAVTRRGELIGAGLTRRDGDAVRGVVIFGKEIQDGDLPFVMLAMRFAGTAVGARCRSCGSPAGRSSRARASAAAVAIAGTIGYGTESAFYFAGLNHGSAAAVTLLFYTYPVWVMLATIALDRRGAGRGSLFVALGLALAGSAIVVVGGGDASTSSPRDRARALHVDRVQRLPDRHRPRTSKRTDPLTAGLVARHGSAAVANVVYALAFRAMELPEGGLAGGSSLGMVGVLGRRVRRACWPASSGSARCATRSSGCWSR